MDVSDAMRKAISEPVPVMIKKIPCDTRIIRSATRVATIDQSGSSKHDVSDADLRTIQELEEINNKFIRGNKAKKTLAKRENEGTRFLEWLKSRNELRDVTAMPIKLLDRLLAVYVEQYEKKDGGQYQVGCVTTNMSALKAFLAEKGVNTSLLGVMQDAMDSKVKDLKAKGFGNVPNAAQYILPDQEEKMWTEGVFGRDTPRKLIYTLIFYLDKIIGWRAENEARQCQIQDMVRKIDGNGTVYYEWAERLTKTRRGKKIFRPVTPRIYPNDLNPNRCVVNFLDEYLEKRRDNTEPSFFLSVNSNFERGDKGTKNWYSNQPMGVETLSKVVKTVAKQANLGDGRFTNHSTKKTIAGNMKALGLPDEFTCDFTNHKDVQTLRKHYNHINADQQRAVCQILQNPKQLIPSYEINNPLSTLPVNASAQSRAEQVAGNPKLAAHCSNYVILWDNLTM